MNALCAIGCHRWGGWRRIKGVKVVGDEVREYVYEQRWCHARYCDETETRGYCETGVGRLHRYDNRI